MRALTESKAGVKDVHWYTSPVAARILERLECRGELSPDQMATQCFVQHKYAIRLCKVMLSAGVIHVTGWRHNSHGSPTPLYRLGPGRNRSMPKKQTEAVRSKARRDSMRDLFGVKVTNITLSSYRIKSRIVIDGKTIRPKDHDAHIAGKISR